MSRRAAKLVRVGEQKNITLADGSKLHLNTDSIVTVDFTENARNIVLLRGEAHFDVAHDTSRPFTVTAGNNTVTAVGTAFNMQYVDDQAFDLVVQTTFALDLFQLNLISECIYNFPDV